VTIGSPEGPSEVVRTATVTRGTVTAKVTGSGNAISSVSTPVNAAASGTITAINVKPGDSVNAGDVLATLDPAGAQANLRIAQAALDSAQAAHRQAAAGPTDVQKQQDQLAITQAQQDVASAQTAQQKAEKQLELDKDSTATAIDNAKTKLDLDEKAQNTAVSKAQSAYDACRRGSSGSPTSAQSTSTSSSSSSDCSTEQQELTSAKQTRESVLTTDEQAITTAEQQQKNTLLQSTYAVTTAKQAVTAAQSKVTGAQLTAKGNLTPQTPDQIEQAKAAADTAQVQVDNAQRALDQTQIKAPQAGVVLSVNGKVGETTGPNNGGSNNSSGSNSSSSTSSNASASNSSSSSGSSSSSEFIAIANLSQMAVTANIAEADAAKIQLGQRVDVTFAATNATATGSVTQITPQSTVQNNVVLYPVTVSLDTAPPNVGVGATASMSINAGSVDNVLMAPSAAITTVGNNHTATVRRNSVDTVVPVQIGMVGDAMTEIKSGLAEGDVLVLPSPTTAAAPSTNRGLPPRVGGR
jgi:HlyD family secretion protein